MDARGGDVRCGGDAARMTERFAACFADRRTAELVGHQVETMVMQRVVGIARAPLARDHHRRVDRLAFDRQVGSGFLTSAAEVGASIWKLSEVSRHKSLDTLRGYALIRPHVVSRNSC